MNWPQFYIPTRKEKIRTALGLEQNAGHILIASSNSELRGKKSTSVDRTWAVRDYEQGRRQRKRDKYQERMRPILTFRKLVTMRTTGWEWT